MHYCLQRREILRHEICRSRDQFTLSIWCLRMSLSMTSNIHCSWFFVNIFFGTFSLMRRVFDTFSGAFLPWNLQWRAECLVGGSNQRSAHWVERGERSKWREKRKEQQNGKDRVAAPRRRTRSVDNSAATTKRMNSKQASLQLLMKLQAQIHIQSSTSPRAHELPLKLLENAVQISWRMCKRWYLRPLLFYIILLCVGHGTANVGASHVSVCRWVRSALHVLSSTDQKRSIWWFFARREPLSFHCNPPFCSTRSLSITPTCLI